MVLYSFNNPKNINLYIKISIPDALRYRRNKYLRILNQGLNLIHNQTYILILLMNLIGLYAIKMNDLDGDS